MKSADTIIYKIEIRIESVGSMPLQKQLSDLGIPASYLRDDQVNHVIKVDRLITKYRGNKEEQDWQDSIKKICDATFSFAAWTPLPGYPQGEIGEPTEQQSEPAVEPTKPTKPKSTTKSVAPVSAFGQEEIEL